MLPQQKKNKQKESAGANPAKSKRMKFVNNSTPLNAETLNPIELSTSTQAGTVAKDFGSTSSALTVGDEFELTFTSGNTAATPTATINNVGRSFRIGGKAVSGQTLNLGNGAKVRCFWDGTYLQLYGNQGNFPTASQTVLGGVKVWLSNNDTTLNISTT